MLASKRGCFERAGGEPIFPMIQFDDGGVKSTGLLSGNLRLLQSGGSDR